MVVVEARVYAWQHYVWQHLSHAARFGRHTPVGHKRPLLPLPTNTIMAQLAKALQTIPITLCLNLVHAVFFFPYIIIIII